MEAKILFAWLGASPVVYPAHALLLVEVEARAVFQEPREIGLVGAALSEPPEASHIASGVPIVCWPVLAAPATALADRGDESFEAIVVHDAGACAASTS